MAKVLVHVTDIREDFFHRLVDGDQFSRPSSTTRATDGERWDSSSSSTGRHEPRCHLSSTVARASLPSYDRIHLRRLGVWSCHHQGGRLPMRGGRIRTEVTISIMEREARRRRHWLRRTGRGVSSPPVQWRSTWAVPMATTSISDLLQARRTVTVAIMYVLRWFSTGSSSVRGGDGGEA